MSTQEGLRTIYVLALFYFDYLDKKLIVMINFLIN
jgi:hypothetical protein